MAIEPDLSQAALTGIIQEREDLVFKQAELLRDLKQL
jgi:hypothetical protein